MRSVRSAWQIPEALVERCAALAKPFEERSGIPVADSIREMSHAYTADRGALREIAESPAGRAARLRFYLPRDLPKLFPLFEELWASGAFPRAERLRALDLGAGLGTSTLALSLFAASVEGIAEIDVVAVDHDAEALHLAKTLCSEARSLGGVPTSVELERTDIERALEMGRGRRAPHVILFGLSLNEVTGGDAAVMARLLGKAARSITDDGAVIVLEPALRDTTRALQHARDLLVASGEAFVFSPCPHDAPCPMLGGERDWCHADLDLPLPPALSELARSAGLREEKLTYTALILRRRAGRATDRLRDAEGGSFEAARAVSRLLPSKGKVELACCAERGELVRLMRLTREAHGGTHALDRVHRGAIVAFSGGREKATRLRLDASAQVRMGDVSKEEGTE